AAVRAELLRHHRNAADGQPQDQGNFRRDQAPARGVQGLDPDPVPEHRLSRFPTIVSGPIDNGWTGYRGYIMEAVRNELENTYGRSRQKIYTGGLRIVTTFN